MPTDPFCCLQTVWLFLRHLFLKSIGACLCGFCSPPHFEDEPSAHLLGSTLAAS